MAENDDNKNTTSDPTKEKKWNLLPLETWNGNETFVCSTGKMRVDCDDAFELNHCPLRKFENERDDKLRDCETIRSFRYLLIWVDEYGCLFAFAFHRVPIEWKPLSNRAKTARIHLLFGSTRVNTNRWAQLRCIYHFQFNSIFSTFLFGIPCRIQSEYCSSREQPLFVCCVRAQKRKTAIGTVGAVSGMLQIQGKHNCNNNNNEKNNETQKTTVRKAQTWLNSHVNALRAWSYGCFNFSLAKTSAPQHRNGIPW